MKMNKRLGWLAYLLLVAFTAGLLLTLIGFACSRLPPEKAGIGVLGHLHRDADSSEHLPNDPPVGLVVVHDQRADPAETDLVPVDSRPGVHHMQVDARRVAFEAHHDKGVLSAAGISTCIAHQHAGDTVDQYQSKSPE